jgi:hypothetical protein
MPKVKISEYSSTANSNTDVASINIDEGCAPSGINNAIRAVMGHLKDFQTGAVGDPFNGPVNGTVGATTPAAGAFTTLSATGVTTVQAGSAGSPAITTSGDTNTGIFFPAADTIAFSEGGAESMRINSSGNVGIGITPSANEFGKNLQVNQTILNDDNAGTNHLSKNAYYSSGWKYITTDFASKYTQSLGTHQWSNAPSGTAGNAVTFTERMRIDDSGNVGIGTSSPSAKLHVASQSGNNTVRLDCAGGGNTSDLTFGAFGFGAVAGLRFEDGNALLRLYADGGRTIAFDNNGSERMRIDTSGNLLVGTTNSTSTGGIGVKARSNGQLFSVIDNTIGDTLDVYNTSVSAYRFYVSGAGTINATNTTITGISDQRLKENIRDLDDGLDVVMALKPRKFDWKEGKGQDIKNARGFIAQEFEQVLPDMIQEWKDSAPEGEEPYKAVNANLIPTLVKAIQEQQVLITQLQADVAALKGN